MEWKCKKCGHAKFDITEKIVKHFPDVVLDEEGVAEYSLDGFKETRSEVIECSNCKNKDDNGDVTNIAELK